MYLTKVQKSWNGWEHQLDVLLILESIAQAEEKLVSETSRYEHVIKKLELELEETKQKLTSDE